MPINSYQDSTWITVIEVYKHLDEERSKRKNKNTNETSTPKKNKKISFAPRSWNKLKCSVCWDKISKNQVDSHKSLHEPNPTKCKSVVESINIEISRIIEWMIKFVPVAKDINHYRNILSDKWILRRIEKIRIRINELATTDKNKIIWLEKMEWF